MSALERPSPYGSPPDRFVPQPGQNAALSGSCLPQFLQNMPGFLSSFYDAGEELFVQYDTMKTEKINRKTEKRNKKREDRSSTETVPCFATARVRE